MRCILALLAFSACAPMAVRHQADAAFRRALTAQLAGDDSAAEEGYRKVIALGVEDSPTLNNLGVIAVRHHDYIQARRLFGQAVKADGHDVVALTNYGVISFYLADLGEARRTLDGARQLRKDLLAQIPSFGRGRFEEERWEKVTQPLDRIAEKYLKRCDEAQELGRAALISSKELMASLSTYDL